MKKTQRKIRPIVLALFRRDDHILVTEMILDGRYCYRPIGGGIEHGEYGVDAVYREVWEELEAEITPPRYLATVENIFMWQGQVAHEIVLIFETAFVDDGYYVDECVIGYEQEGDETFLNRWLPLSYFKGENAPPLYPDGLIALL